MRRRALLMAMLAPLPALAAPPRPANDEITSPVELVRGARRSRLSTGIYGSGRRTHWNRDYTPRARPRTSSRF